MKTNRTSLTKANHQRGTAPTVLEQKTNVGTQSSTAAKHSPAKQVSHKAVISEVSELALKIRTRMVEGLRMPRGIEPEFDLIKLNEAVRIFSQIDANSADDSTFSDKALFNITTNGEAPLFNAIKTLVTGLNHIQDGDNFDFESIEDSARTLFLSTPEYPTGTPGQLLVKSISEIVNKRKKITSGVEGYLPLFQALDKFLQTLQYAALPILNKVKAINGGELVRNVAQVFA